jgi:hypothetical protein
MKPLEIMKVRRSSHPCRTLIAESYVECPLGSTGVCRAMCNYLPILRFDGPVGRACLAIQIAVVKESR